MIFLALYALCGLLCAVGLALAVLSPADPWTSWHGIEGDD